MGIPIVFNKTMAASSSNNIALSQSPATAKLTLNGSAVTSGVATIDTKSSTNTAVGRRVILTSGGDDSGINWVVVGTNSTGSVITDTFVGSNGGAAQSNLDFVTVTSITPSASVASTVIAGTNGFGSSSWQQVNWHVQDINIGFAVELVSGAANFTVQHTYDDPNQLLAGVTSPLAFNHPLVVAQSANIDGSYMEPISMIRLLINSGTGQVRFRMLQSGIG
jgi:hypothetical protein